MRKEITERRETINTPSHETKDVVQDDDESGTMDWFTKVFVSLKVGTDLVHWLACAPSDPKRDSTGLERPLQ